MPRPARPRTRTVKRRLIRSPIAGIALGLSIGVFATAAVDRAWLLAEGPDVAHYRRVRDFVTRAFVGETNQQRMVDDALRGLAGGLDEYSRYYDSLEMRELER